MVFVFVDLSFRREFENLKLQKWVETHGQKCSRRTRIENFDHVFLVYNAYTRLIMSKTFIIDTKPLLKCREVL